MRLQKFLARCGVASRRKAEELIRSGVISVNGQLITQMGTQIDPNQDIIQINGETASLVAEDSVYVIMNKPRSVVTTLSDPEGRKTVRDICPEITERVFPVGRLDYLSEGLLLLTNDGDFAQEVIHPRQGIEKVYEVKVFGNVSKVLLKKLREGAKDQKGNLLVPRSVRIIQFLRNKTWLEFRLTEGKNREIRNICEAHSLAVDKLRRVAIGGLSLTGVPLGKYRIVSKKALTRSIYSGPFRSPKKSLTKEKRSGVMADDKKYAKYQKENYQQTMHVFKTSDHKVS